MADKLSITFLPSGTETKIEKGSTLYEAALQAGITLNSPCGGLGSCGKCKAALFPEGTEVLACRHKPQSDSTVKIASPNFSICEEKIETAAYNYTHPLFQSIEIEIKPPDKNDIRDDLSRFSVEFSKILETNLPVELNFQLLKKLPQMLRQCDWKPFILFIETDKKHKILYIGPKKDFTVAAVDLGTTTIHLSLIKAETGKELLRISFPNLQLSWGAETITRIINYKKNGKLITQATVQSINKLLEHISSSQLIIGMALSGNTAMIHMLFGINPEYIRKEPYIPAVSYIEPLDPHFLGINDAKSIITTPAITGFIGGDIVSGIISCRLYEENQPCFLMDIGTNGEIVLGCRDFIITCSASAGPAFEGAGIKCGMRAETGAIEKAWMENGKIKYSVIGDTEPVGICGSGLISLVSLLFEKNIIDAKGSFSCGDKYIIAKTDKENIYLDNDDIKNILRAKAALYAGCEILLQKTGLTFNEIGKFYIAGSISKSLNIEDSISIGLLPDIKREKFVKAGNTSLKGTMDIIRDRNLLHRAHLTAKDAAYIDLSDDANFFNEWTAAFLIPHTDHNKFPNSRKGL